MNKCCKPDPKPKEIPTGPDKTEELLALLNIVQNTASDSSCYYEEEVDEDQGCCEI